MTSMTLSQFLPQMCSAQFFSSVFLLFNSHYLILGCALSVKVTGHVFIQLTYNAVLLVPFGWKNSQQFQRYFKQDSIPNSLLHSDQQATCFLACFMILSFPIAEVQRVPVALQKMIASVFCPLWISKSQDEGRSLPKGLVLPETGTLAFFLKTWHLHCC